MPKYQLHVMTHKDLSSASSLVCDCYRHICKIEGYRCDIEEDLIQTRGSEASIARQMKHCEFIIAKYHGNLVGLTSIHKNEIDKLYVLPLYHRKGIGRLLFREACRQISAKGYTFISLAAFPSAVPFYTSMGMTHIGNKQIDTGPMAGLNQPLLEMHLKTSLISDSEK